MAHPHPAAPGAPGYPPPVTIGGEGVGGVEIAGDDVELDGLQHDFVDVDDDDEGMFVDIDCGG